MSHTQVTIKDKIYPLYMGLDFIKVIDEIYISDINTYGLSIGKLFVGLSQLNPVAISNFIKAGTSTLTVKPLDKDIEEYLMGLSVEEIEELALNFLKLLAENSLTKPQIMTISQISQGQQSETA